jgi:hypothetical protein
MWRTGVVVLAMASLVPASAAKAQSSDDVEASSVAADRQRAQPSGKLSPADRMKRIQELRKELVESGNRGDWKSAGVASAEIKKLMKERGTRPTPSDLERGQRFFILTPARIWRTKHECNEQAEWSELGVRSAALAEGDSGEIVHSPHFRDRDNEECFLLRLKKKRSGIQHGYVRATKLGKQRGASSGSVETEPRKLAGDDADGRLEAEARDLYTIARSAHQTGHLDRDRASMRHASGIYAVLAQNYAKTKAGKVARRALSSARRGRAPLGKRKCRDYRSADQDRMWCCAVEDPVLGAGEAQCEERP